MRFIRLQSTVLTLSLLVFAGFVANIATPVARAQADLGSVIGIVTDSTGAVVPNAAVKVTNQDTGAVRNSVTNGKGEYAITQLLPANYTLTVTAPGFASAKKTVSVTVGSQNGVNIKLAVSGGTTQVIVAADDFAGVQLEKPEVSTVIETNQILSLPTLDRNPYNLVAFSGNLSSDPTVSGGGRGVGFNISGARSSDIDILLDGSENTDMYAVGVGQSVPMDATAEIRIVTSNGGAEYGRGSGAVNVSTKSGSNGLHGSVYEFNRISTLASDGYNNNYIHFMNPSVTAKPRYTHNQYGYSFGGPIKKDKIFFFSSTEWTKIRSAQNVVSIVPTSDLINLSSTNMKSFFTTYGTLATPINGTTYKGNSSAVQKVWGKTDVVYIGETEMGLDPSETTITPDSTGNYCADPQIASSAICTTALFGQSIYSYPGDSGGGAPVNQWITFNRADFTFSQTTSMFVRYIQESAVNPAGYVNNSPYKGYNTEQTQFNHSIEVSLSHAFSSNLASATKLLGSRLNNAQPLAEAPISPTLYINAGSPVTLGSGYINFPGYSQTSPGNALPFGGPQNFIQIGEDLAWSKGKNQFTFGGNFLYLKDNRVFGAYEEAIDALATSGSKYALSNFINGNMQEVEFAINPQGAYPCYRNASGVYQQTAACTINLPATSPNFSRSNRYQDGAAYANDSWKVTPKFTLNLGVRWEIYGPQHSQKPAYDANFFPDYSQNNPWDQIRNGQVLTRANAPNGRMWNLNKKQFGPKIGFAWDPFGNGKTSIRGGYSISYSRNFGNVTFNVIQNPPNYGVVAFTQPQTSYTQTGLTPINNANLGVFGTGTGSLKLPNVTLRAVDPRIKPSYANNWSLSVERQIAGSTASLSYVGTRGIHNYSIANVNRYFDGSTYEGDARTANRTNYQYSNINWRGADGDSYYHGLTGELRSADLAHTGLNVRADYTWAHSIDNNSSTFSDGGNSAGGGLVLGYTDAWQHGLDRGSSDFDQKHRAAVALVWQVPFGKHTTGVTKLLADNWTLSDTFTAQTGNPFTEFDCLYGYTVCPRTSFTSDVPRKRTRNMQDISAIEGPNTFSYLTLPNFYDQTGTFDSGVDEINYNEQINPNSGTSDNPICTGIHGAGCHLVPNMDGRNMFRGPGSWTENLGIVKDFKIHERYALQFKGEFINVLNHANTYLNLNGANDVSSYTDVLAYKSGNRNTELSLHLEF
jgi:hypothetical protein